jgi:1,6-anhydro-N-acetylmuramate kinase
LNDTRLVIGCMTGTSLDGIDLALAGITGSGLAMRVHCLAHAAEPMPAELRATLMHLARGGEAAPIMYMRAARALGRLHADAIKRMIASQGVAGLDMVVAHGQTIWHAPADGTGERMSWQLFDPWPVVRDIGVRVCFDLRQADLIAAGQGAPITPLADWVIYQLAARSRAIVNLGGVCNITWLDAGIAGPDAIRGADVCPCNLLIDGLVQLIDPTQRYDVDGRLATQGKPSGFVLEAVRAKLATLPASQRTLGREDVTVTWLGELREQARAAKLSDADLFASAVYAVAELIVSHIARISPAATLVLAGGGVRNDAMLVALKERATAHRLGDVLTTDALGVPAEAREALGFAVLGALSEDGVPITLPAVTGATQPGRAGLWAMP